MVITQSGLRHIDHVRHRHRWAFEPVTWLFVLWAVGSAGALALFLARGQFDYMSAAGTWAVVGPITVFAFAKRDLANRRRGQGPVPEFAVMSDLLAGVIALSVVSDLLSGYRSFVGVPLLIPAVTTALVAHRHRGDRFPGGIGAERPM